MQVKEFYCTIHPKDKIRRISLNSHHKTLFCFQCVGEESNCCGKPDLISLNDFLENLTLSYQHLNINQVKATPAKEVLHIIGDQEKLIDAFSEEIVKQKAMVINKFKEIEDQVVKSVRSVCSEIISDLDTELMRLKFKIGDLGIQTKSLLTWDLEKAYKYPFDLESIIAEINRAASTQEYELLITNLSGYTTRFLKLQELQGKKDKIFEYLNDLQQELTDNLRFPPKSLVIDDYVVNEQKRRLDISIRDNLKILKQFESYKEALTSPTALLTQNNYDALLSLLFPQKELVRFHLLAKAKPDGSDLQQVIDRYFEGMGRLIMIKDNIGDIFGVYVHGGGGKYDRTGFDLTNMIAKKYTFTTKGEEDDKGRMIHELCDELILTPHEKERIMPMFLSDIAEAGLTLNPDNHLCMGLAFFKCTDEMLSKDKSLIKYIAKGVDEVEVFKVAMLSS